MNTATIYDELTAETSKGSCKLTTWLTKAKEPEMPREAVEAIIAYALLSWDQLAALRGKNELPKAILKQHPSEPANGFEIVMFYVHRYAGAAAFMVPKIRKWYAGRDALQIRLATKPKQSFESDYDLQAALRERIPGLTDDQITKRRQRIEAAIKRNQ
jgi:hypothetical protein